jgi:branched-chain amino acid transport system permease protein
LLALRAAFPLVAPAFDLDYYVGFVRHLLIVMIAATSLNFILGYGGMAALGHAGFIGVGAYTVVALVDAGFTSAWGPGRAACVVSAAVCRGDWRGFAAHAGGVLSS